MASTYQRDLNVFGDFSHSDVLALVYPWGSERLAGEGRIRSLHPESVEWLGVDHRQQRRGQRHMRGHRSRDERGILQRPTDRLHRFGTRTRLGTQGDRGDAAVPLFRLRTTTPDLEIALGISDRIAYS